MNENQPTNLNPSKGLALLTGFVLIIIGNISAMACFYFLGPVGFFPMLLLLAIIPLPAQRVLGDGILWIYIIFLLVAVTSWFQTEQLEMITGKAEKGVRLQDFVLKPGKRRYVFLNARVLNGMKISSSNLTSSRDSKNHTTIPVDSKFFLAPLVSSEWKRGDILDAWVCSRTLSGISSWNKLEANTGVLVKRDYVWKLKIRELLGKYNLQEKENAPMFEWFVDEKALQKEKRGFILYLCLIYPFAWLLLAAIFLKL
ncbi:MAG: hypothetical protein H7A25_08215 [Leptospiraceae bacterium]|nr:hypothetical protein [Leptospiraceae bacterium]MCP5499871.1 hypothetical protein [Leptospiraceae bacterium]